MRYERTGDVMRCTAALTQSLLCFLALGTAMTVARDGIPGSAATAASPADTNEPGTPRQETAGPETLTNGFWGLSDRLADYGIEVTLGSTNVYQTNAKGGLETHQQSGRFSGSYDMQIATDLEKLLGMRGLGLLVHGWGGYPATPGINDTMVGSAFNVNWDAIGNPPLDVVEVILEWKPFGDLLAVEVGKINFARVFDTSEYANDETSQFLNGAFVNNPTVPMPNFCFGAIVSAHLTDSWFLAAGMGDAEADNGTTGFATTFDGDDYFFYALETGIRAELSSPRGPLAGNYHLGLWYDPQPKGNSDSDKTYRNDVGFYTTCDQMLLKENDQPDDHQGLGAFLRYGYTDAKRNDLTQFWSAGFQYQGLLAGRDDDVLGLGFARGTFSPEASATFPDGYEAVLETYYNAQLTHWAHASPSVQYVAHPGGSGVSRDAVVVAVRAQIAF
jgi:porin